MRVVSGLRRRPLNQRKLEPGSRSRVMFAVTYRRVDLGFRPDLPVRDRFVRATRLPQDVVSPVPEHWPPASAARASRVGRTRCPLVFRTSSSPTGSVLDQAACKPGMKPEPSTVLDACDGVSEAVADGLRHGFVWEFGSSRNDRIEGLRVTDVHRSHRSTPSTSRARTASF